MMQYSHDESSAEIHLSLRSAMFYVLRWIIVACVRKSENKEKETLIRFQVESLVKHFQNSFKKFPAV